MTNFFDRNNILKGGAGSGFFGHKGRDAENKRGGSVARDSKQRGKFGTIAGQNAAFSSKKIEGHTHSDNWEKSSRLIQKDLSEKLGQKVWIDDAADVYDNRDLDGEPIGSIKVDDEGKWSYKPKKTEKSLTSSILEDIGIIAYGYGNEVKSLGIDGLNGKIGSYSIIFEGPDNQDLQGNNFTKSTFLGHLNGDGAVATFNHRIPIFDTSSMNPEVANFIKTMQSRVMKNPIHTTVDAVGVFSELVCDLSDRYEKAIFDLASQGKLKWSSGTAPHLYEAAPNGELKMFVIAEQGLTPIPAEYKMIQHKVMPLKSYVEFLKDNL